MSGSLRFLSAAGVGCVAIVSLAGLGAGSPSALPGAAKLAAAAIPSQCGIAPLGACARLGILSNDDAPQTGAGALPQATFGGGIFRNLVNTVDKNVPTDWNVEDGKFKNVKWVADVGTRSYGGPVILGGRVFVGTNNDKPRDPKIKGPKAVLMCFAEKDGKFLWQNVHNQPDEAVIREALSDGLCSTPTVEGDFVYYVTPGCEVICASVQDGKVQWRYDMMKELKVFPCYLCNCSPLLVGDIIYLITGQGRDSERKIVTPQAPSFVALSKKDGKLVWQSNLPGANIIEGQWSNPVYAEPGGKPQVIFAAGDGWIYSLQPKTGDLIWKFQGSFKPGKGESGIQAYFVSTPVVEGDRLFVGVGAGPEISEPVKVGHFFCIDITKTGDVSCKNSKFDPQDPVNKGSALVWHFGGLVEPPPARGRSVRFGRTLSAAAVHDGLVYISEEEGYLRCLDAKTGQSYWEHDVKSGIWGSPSWVDNRIYLCPQDGNCLIYPHGKTLKQPVAIDMQEVLETTPLVVNGVLYIATKNRIYAISPGGK
jgi:outer membrane protein assembly factor BamB